MITRSGWNQEMAPANACPSIASSHTGHHRDRAAQGPLGQGLRHPVGGRRDRRLLTGNLIGSSKHPTVLAAP